jgi:hypothetical protein
MVSCLIESQNVLLSTNVLCHFWPRLINGMGINFYGLIFKKKKKKKKKKKHFQSIHGFLGA